VNAQSSDIGAIVTLLLGAQLMSYLFVAFITYIVLTRMLGGKTIVEMIGFVRKHEDQP
jgi:hypothetical protein